MCALCASQLPSFVPNPLEWTGPYLSHLHALGTFDGGLRDLLHLFKFGGRDYLGSFLMNLWCQRIPELRDDIDMVIPVPMSPWKEIRRGYNQSAVLARELGRRWARPVREQVLRRRWWSRSQVRLDRKRRLKNAPAGYRLAAAGGLYNKRILLVDDVCTTGATLNACAALLRRAGASEVRAGVLGVEVFKTR